MRVFSFGGGVQSTAVLVLAAQGSVQYDAFVFANVGEDSENPATIAYVATVARPYATQHGIRFEEVRRTNRNYPDETLLEWTLRSERSIRIPVRMANGAPGRRTCTGDFKIAPIGRWLKQQGATPENPATLGLGISLDEIHRMRTDSGIPWEVLEYPLVDRRLTRNDCLRIVKEAGLAQPPKSSCWFCPYHTKGSWQEMKRKTPALFEQAVALERTLNERRTTIGRDAVYFHSSLKMLDKAVGDQGHFDDLMDNCEEGFCGV